MSDPAGDRASGPVGATGPRRYALPAALRVRLGGLALVGVGSLLLVAAGVIVLLHVPRVVLTVLVVVAAVLVVALAYALMRRWYVVRLDDTGYQVRFVRGVGRARARWTDVEDLTTAVVSGTRCVVLRLRDGGTSTIPVNIVEGDREEFVDELQRRLDAGHGYRRL